MTKLQFECLSMTPTRTPPQNRISQQKRLKGPLKQQSKNILYDSINRRFVESSSIAQRCERVVTASTVAKSASDEALWYDDHSCEKV
jgi:hypothetical protein